MGGGNSKDRNDEVNDVGHQNVSALKTNCRNNENMFSLISGSILELQYCIIIFIITIIIIIIIILMIIIIIIIIIIF